MEAFEPWANLYQQEHATIYGHGVWHYLIDTPLGQYHIVQYEGKGMEIKETVIAHDNAKAERQFRKYCNDLLKGNI